MKRLGLGVREYVGLGVLALTIALGAAVYAWPGDEPSTPLRPTPTAVAVRTTASVEPGKSTAGRWTLSYYSIGVKESETLVAQGDVAEVHVDAPGAPFPDVHDDSWKLVAVTTFDEPEGDYQLLVTYRGDVKLFVGPDQVGQGSARDRAATFGATFHKGPAASVVRVEIVDRGGPTLLDVRLNPR